MNYRNNNNNKKKKSVSKGNLKHKKNTLNNFILDDKTTKRKNQNKSNSIANISKTDKLKKNKDNGKSTTKRNKNTLKNHSFSKINKIKNATGNNFYKDILNNNKNKIINKNHIKQNNIKKKKQAKKDNNINVVNDNNYKKLDKISKIIKGIQDKPFNKNNINKKLLQINKLIQDSKSELKKNIKKNNHENNEDTKKKDMPKKPIIDKKKSKKYLKKYIISKNIADEPWVNSSNQKSIDLLSNDLLSNEYIKKVTNKSPQAKSKKLQNLLVKRQQKNPENDNLIKTFDYNSFKNSDNNDNNSLTERGDIFKLSTNKQLTNNNNFQNFIKDSIKNNELLLKDTKKSTDNIITIEDNKDKDIIHNDNKKKTMTNSIIEEINDKAHIIYNNIIDDVFADPLYTKLLGSSSTIFKLANDSELIPNEIESVQYSNNADNSINSNRTAYGIRTNFNAVSEYSTLLIKYLMEKRSDILTQLLPNGSLTQESYISLINDLKYPYQYIHNYYKIEIYNHMTNTINIKNKIFNELENELVSNLKESDKFEKVIKYQSLFHKSIFDSLFEELELLLIDKIPSFNLLIFYYNYSKNFIDTKFKFKEEDSILTAKDNLMENAAVLCGIIRDKEDSMIGNLHFLQEHLFEQIKEERMQRMLALDTLENDKDWVEFDIFYYKIVNECEEDILNLLLTDIINNFNL